MQREKEKSGTRQNNKSKQKSIVTSVLKACRLVECFSHDRPELALAELAKGAKMNKSTARRMLATLELAGWIDRRADHCYRLGIKLFQIGSIPVSNLDLRVEAKSILVELATRIGETTYLMIPDGTTRAVCLERVEGASPTKLSLLSVGASRPFYVGAGPLVILAFREEDFLAAVIRRGLRPLTDNTTVEVGKLKERLGEVRQKGYGLSMEDIVPGVCAVGAPVYDKTGTVVAAISIGGLCERLLPRIDSIVAGVVDGAKRLSTRLGYAETSPTGLPRKESTEKAMAVVSDNP